MIGKRGMLVTWLVASPILAFAAAPCVDKSELPAVSGQVIEIASEPALQSALANAQGGETLLLKPGTYNLTATLYVRDNNVTIRGDGDSCDDVVLMGRGMENSSYGAVPHGVWSDAESLSVVNITIKDVYLHGIVLNPGAQNPVISSVQLLNAGQQFLKSNPTTYGVGVDNGVVENSLFAYESSPPMSNHGGGTGYTNGVDVHAGDGWVIRGNRFENFHTPDAADHLWNPAILVWNGATDTVAENNSFINVDRAISFGLIDRSQGYDHQGGVIRNNMIYYEPGLYSSQRTINSDAAIIVWDSPSTQVVHNSIVTNGNLNKSIEFRFSTTGSSALNNLVDAPIGSRNGAVFTQLSNFLNALPSMFVDARSGKPDLKYSEAGGVIDQVNRLNSALVDFYGENRPAADGSTDIGAYEYGVALSPPNPPSDVQAVPN
ncbi:MAG: hypothetical protein SV765_02560 [Pseudomonadota bacterium]|nr:hypothetical protein [Pseudomonadota bacterium]